MNAAAHDGLRVFWENNGTKVRLGKPSKTSRIGRVHVASMSDAEVSLRPMVLRPGAGPVANPFASFGKGAGFGIQAKKVIIDV